MLKKCGMFCFSILILLQFFLFSTNVYADESESLDIDISAKSAILIEASTGKILFEKNAYEKLPMASTSKIMTALIALEQADIDKKFEVDPNAIMVEGSSMGLRKGDLVSLRDLSYGMLLSSGNDAANATAVAISGDITRFAGLMNEKAKDIGLENTSFETPSGLDGENHFSTAYDMAQLANYALDNQDFFDICSQKSAKISFGNPPQDRWLSNHNRLLKELEGCIGVKTGYTKKSGRCLVSAVEQDGIRLICVTLNASDDWNDHKNLYKFGYENISEYKFIPDLSDVKLNVVGGEKNKSDVYINQDEISIILTDEDKNKLEEKIILPRFVYAPINRDIEVGKIAYKIDDKILCEVPLFISESIDISNEQSFFEKIKSWFIK